MERSVAGSGQRQELVGGLNELREVALHAMTLVEMIVDGARGSRGLSESQNVDRAVNSVRYLFDDRGERGTFHEDFGTAMNDWGHLVPKGMGSTKFANVPARYRSSDPCFSAVDVAYELVGTVQRMIWLADPSGVLVEGRITYSETLRTEWDGLRGELAKIEVDFAGLSDAIQQGIREAKAKVDLGGVDAGFIPHQAMAEPEQGVAGQVDGARAHEPSEWPPDEGWHFDRPGYVAFRGKVQAVSGIERQLIEHLANARRPVTRKELIRQFWTDKLVGDEAVDQKLKAVRKVLRTMFGLTTTVNPIPSVDSGQNAAWELNEAILAVHNPVSEKNHKYAKNTRDVP